MFTKLNVRDILAWLILGAAMILLTISVSYAQDLRIQKKDNGEVLLKYSDGKKKNKLILDTLFIAKTPAEYDKAIKAINEKYKLDIQSPKTNMNDIKIGKSKSTLSYEINVTDTDNGSQKTIIKKGDIDFDKSMEKFEQAMQELEKSMKNLHFEFSFNNEDAHHDNMSDGSNDDDKKSKKVIKVERIIVNDTEEDEIPDSLKSDDRIIIIGEKDEKVPTFEKTLPSKSGKQIFIYKRSGSTSVRPIKNDDGNIQDFKVFPNPTKSELNVSFSLRKEGDVQLFVLDQSGKTIYKLVLDGLQGEFEHKFDLAGKANGSYTVKLVSGGEKQVQKIIVN